MKTRKAGIGQRLCDACSRRLSWPRRNHLPRSRDQQRRARRCVGV